MTFSKEVYSEIELTKDVDNIYFVDWILTCLYP